MGFSIEKYPDPGGGKKVNDTFEQLKAHVGSVHELTSNAAKGAINQMLTVRNLFFHL